MRQAAVPLFLLGLCGSGLSAEAPKPLMRPISGADAILAVYREDWGLASSGDPAIVFAAWPDGHVLWSGDRLRGGAPYRTGRVEPKRVTALLERFDKDGLFADDRLSRPNVGPDSEFITVLVKSGKKRVQMRSWHELLEAPGDCVVDHRGASALRDRRRLDVLRKAPADYLFYRLVWCETRTRLGDLIPGESTASAGNPVMKAGVLSWKEPAAGPVPHGGPPGGSGRPPREPPYADTLERRGWKANFRRGQEILRALAALDAGQREKLDVAAYRGERVAFLGGSAPPGGTNDLFTKEGYYLRVVNRAGRDLRPHAVWWEAMVCGKIWQVLPENKIIVIEVAEEDWLVLQTG